MLHIMIARAALEIVIAEHALTLLGVSILERYVSQRLVLKQLESRKSELDFAWAVKAGLLRCAEPSFNRAW